MTAASIGAGKAGGYARYLEGKTMAPERGDYYLHPSGEPTQTPGRWLSSSDTLAALGIDGQEVKGEQFVALLEGRHPVTGRWIRPAGANGDRGGGIDLTFSAPKSVSAVWALGDHAERQRIEDAHAKAVTRTVSHLTATVPTVRRRLDGKVIEQPAENLIAAEYRHTTARGVLGGEPPDPQLHSHLVITGAVREDGRIVAVASRPLFRAARELGAYYRSALADELHDRGYGVLAGTGREGRYFEIDGVPQTLLDAFSARSREVTAAAERFRAEHGRQPQRGELRHLKLENRRAKRPVTHADLQRHWRRVAREHHYNRRTLRERAPRPHDRAGDLDSCVEERLTTRAATFDQGELRAVTLEQTVGHLAPETAIVRAQRMLQDGRVLSLAGGRLTTRRIRAQERTIELRLRRLATTHSRSPGQRALRAAADDVAERIGATLTGEQHAALRVIAGATQAAILVGPAGTGKGVVIDAAARAEQDIGRDTVGIAVSGSTAQRLGRDSPALAGRTLTIDALINRAEHGRLRVHARTTIYLDEAGMTDTNRLGQLTRLADRTGAKLVLIGDATQLPSIGAGGMFTRLTRQLPIAQLEQVRRTPDPAEGRAWADLRAGRTDRALAHYRSRGRLHLNDTREQAAEHAVRDWARLTEALPVNEVLLITDASNKEINRLNARAQHHRQSRGELGELEIQIPGVHYGLRAGDRVALIEQHRETGQPRVENGERGEVIDITREGALLVQFDATGRWGTFQGEELTSLRLAYAQHAYRTQGATVTRALVLTGGWQTSRETGYVQATRAREGTDFYLAREELGTGGRDLDRIERLAAQMRNSRAQIPSLAYDREQPEREPPGRGRSQARHRAARLLERLR